MNGTNDSSLTDLSRLWRHLYDDQSGYIAVFSGCRARPGAKKLTSTREEFFAYPQAVDSATGWLIEESGRGREAYFCAHLVKKRRRRKVDATLVVALWTDGDGATVPDHLPQPTAVVESSPGRYNYFFRLRTPIPPEQAETLNKRLMLAIGADASGYDLTQLTRPPDCHNFKYPDAPVVRLVRLDEDRAVDPDELDRLLPPLPPPPAPPLPSPSVAQAAASSASDGPPVALSATDLSFWTGERWVKKGGGTGNVDRSETLFCIACGLVRGGLRRPALIAQELRDRDRALYPHDPKYAQRPDAEERYTSAAATALQRVGAEDAATPVPGACPELFAENSRLRRELADRDRALRELNRRYRATLALTRREDYDTATRIAPTIAFAVESARERSSNWIDQDTGELWPRLSIGMLAETAGVSPKVAGAAVKTLHDRGQLRRATRIVWHADAEGRCHAREEVGVVLGAEDAVTWLEGLAAAPVRPRGWGGARPGSGRPKKTAPAPPEALWAAPLGLDTPPPAPAAAVPLAPGAAHDTPLQPPPIRRCPDHPKAVLRSKWVCGVCSQEIHQGPEYYDTVQVDGGGGRGNQDGFMPQRAGMCDGQGARRGA